MRKILLWLLLALPGPALAQITPGGGVVIGSPISGSCTNNYNLFNNSGVVGCQANGGGASGITIGTTTITSGTTTRVLYDNAGVVGEYTISGSGNVAMTTSPVFTTPSLGVAAGTSLALTEAAGASALTLTGATQTTSFPVISATQTWNAGGVTFTGISLNITDTTSAAASSLMNLQVAAASKFNVSKAGKLTLSNAAVIDPAGSELNIGAASAASVVRIQANGSSYGTITVSKLFLGGSSGGAQDLIVSRPAAATFQHGDADAAAPVAQAVRFQSVVAGTADTAGAAASFRGSLSTGTGASGDIIFQTGGKGAASTTQNAAIAALTLKGGTTTTLAGSVVLGSAAIATSDTDGFLYLVTMAGAPSGVPTAFTGRAAVIIDTTNNKICFYNGAWKCSAAFT